MALLVIEHAFQCFMKNKRQMCVQEVKYYSSPLYIYFELGISISSTNILINVSGKYTMDDRSSE